MSAEVIKAASPDQEFEQGFFQLAYDKLQSKLYNLLPFLVGFEVVNKSEDGAKAVGVFGFKSGNGQVLLVPTFFVNGKVKDLDTMYSRNNNQFYPLNEDFAEIFLKDDSTGIGSVSSQTRAQMDRNMPPVNFKDLMVPPRTGRIAYASVIDFVEQSPNIVKKAFWTLCDEHPDFLFAVREFYSDEKIAKALVQREEPVVQKEAQVEVIGFNNLEKAASLNDEQKQVVATKGYYILDKRAAESKSRFGNFQVASKFSNPSEPGFYSYITEMGNLRYGLILPRPAQLFSGFSSDDTIVIDLESKLDGQAYIVNDRPVYIKDQFRVQDYSSAHKLMQEPSEALPSFSDTFILINENLKATIPFRIIENSKDASGLRKLLVEPDGASCCPSHSKGKKPKDPADGKVTLVFTKKPGDVLSYKGGFTYVPKGFKLLKIRTSDYVPYESTYGLPDDERKSKEEERETTRKRIKEGRPGSIHHLTSLLAAQDIFPMTVRTNGSEYFLNVGAATRKYPNPIEAKIGMVLDVGLSEKAADEIINALVADIPLEGCVKLAYTGDYVPTLVDEAPYSNELGQPTYQGTPYHDTVPQDISYQGDPTQLGLGVKPEVQGIESDVNNAMQLAQSGQKEIFDTHAIATISKYVDPTNKVVSYIPNFVDTLDKLGRMLFMVYWETKKFQEMYGQDELPELIELLKSVFKNLGDLIIFLKRKFPDISINSNEQALEQG